jgi:two-component system LytT family response regulator
MSKEIRVVIVDDESGARDTLREMIATYCPNLTIVGEGQSVASGIKQIKKSKPDVLFLDIRMPDGTGFDLLEKIDSIDFSVVFLTAYDEYAIKAFKYSAIDYMLKPIDPEELIGCYSKLEKLVRLERSQFEALMDNLNSNKGESRKIILKTAEVVHLMNISEIIRIESDGNYTRFFANNRQPILVSKTLKEYDKLLIDQNFFRVHQSHLINLNRIVQIEKQDGTTVVMDDGSKVPVSFRKKDLLLSVLSKL